MPSPTDTGPEAVRQTVARLRNLAMASTLHGARFAEWHVRQDMEQAAILIEALAKEREWQPIEPPPMDSIPILARLQYITRSGAFPGAKAVAQTEYVVCLIDEDTGDMLTMNGDDIGWKFRDVATHWMPLPAPPETKP